MSVEHEHDHEHQPGPPWPAPSPNGTWWRGEPGTGPDAFPLWPADTTETAEPTTPGAPTGLPVHQPQHAAGSASAQAPGHAAAPPVAQQSAVQQPSAPQQSAPQPSIAPVPQPRPIVGRFAAGRIGERADDGKLGLGPSRLGLSASRLGLGPTRPTPPASPRGRPPRGPRHPVTGLAALVLFALLSGFFGWVSAEPFWLAVGHAQPGQATVTRCEGTGVAKRCLASFEGRGVNSPAMKAARVTLVGADGELGKSYEAHMVDAEGRIAYVGSPDALHLRWIVGLVLVLACGLAIAWGTGAARLSSKRARAGAVALSFAGPLAIFVGMLAATW